MIQMSRLPGRSVKAFGWSSQRHQLWLSPEYLLYREVSGYREVVKRYYYGDIQAIISGPTKASRVFTIILVVVLVSMGLLIALLAASGSPAPLLAVTAFFMLLPAICLVVNLMLGPSCRTTLYTATSEAPLYSLGRKRGAEKAIALMLPFIEAAQRGAAPAAEPIQAPVPEPVEESPAWNPPTEG